MANYYLPEHVHFCGQGSSVIFLDLRKDEYSLINGTQAAIFRRLVNETGNSSPMLAMAEEEPMEAAAFLSELVAAGLLTTEKACGRPVTPTDAHPPEHILIDSDLTTTSHVPVCVKDLWYFLISCLTTTWRLHMRPIEATIGHVSRRKARHGRTGISDFATARHRVAVFNKLRCLFPTDYLCLFDSLSLIEFLARYEVFPDWVFAVRFEPWAAHCWLQYEDILLNDDLEKTEDYIPILRV